MYRYVLPVAVVAAILVGSSSLPAQQAPGDVVVVVNDQPVFMWEVRLLAPQVQSEMARQGVRPEQEAVLQSTTQRLVDLRLLGQEARRLELQPSSERVEQTMAEIVQQAGSRSALDTTLAGIGVTYDQLRGSVAEADLAQVFIASQIDPKVSVSDEDVAAFYAGNPDMFEQPEQIHARHIIMRAAPDDPQEDRDAARARAAAARERALAGEDFSALAGELSEDESASRGGDLGFLSRRNITGPFADAAFALDDGAISEVVETDFGYHVIKVDEKRPPSKMTLDEAREPLGRMLHDQQVGQILAQMLDGLAGAATISQPGAPTAGPESGDGADS
jgi:peptidyl-prolyl cis-trans isomerase C